MTARDKYLRKTYGINQLTYVSMLVHGDYKCWICHKQPKPFTNLHVDHDHKTGQVRGLLCFMCNKRLIGRSKQADAWKYDNAAAYLRSTKDWRVM